MQGLPIILAIAISLASCGAENKKVNENTVAETATADAAGIDPGKSVSVRFDADSAYSYLARQVEFGPRVPNSEAHRKAGDWLASELARHGATVIEQRADLKAFDGTILKARNIFGQYNPEAADRTLLLAHYDCRPWADEDPDPEKRKQPVDGANDGASGVAVLLEVARHLGSGNPGKGIDILFVDAEDWGTEGDDESWAMGARYFANNPVKPGYRPARVIVADMVGGEGASFPVEYFSFQSAPELVRRLWSLAAQGGYRDLFPMSIGSAVTDDHVEFIKAGIPAIDIIEYHPEEGFNPHWHTSGDTLENIDRNTLEAVGSTLMLYLYK